MTSAGRRLRIALAGAVVPASLVAAAGSAHVVASRGVSTGASVAFDSATGTQVDGWPVLDGEVRAIVPDGHGGAYLGGTFTQAAGAAHAGLVHVLADGSVDPGFDPAVSGSVSALALGGDRLYVGGWFTAVDGAACRNLAAIDARDGSLQSWRCDVASAVGQLAVSGSRVVAGENAYGAPRLTGVVAFDVAGRHLWQVRAVFEPLPVGEEASYATVEAIAVRAGSVYVGGYFTSIGHKRRDAVAALELADGSIEPWAPKLGRPSEGCPDVGAIAVVVHRVYLGGAEDFICGNPALQVADTSTGRLSSVHWVDHTLFRINALAASGPLLYIGGYQDTGGGSSPNPGVVEAMDARTGQARPWSPPQPDAPVRAIAATGTRVVVGGSFAGVG